MTPAPETDAELSVAVGQFAASVDWHENVETCTRMMADAQRDDADLLVLPEGVLARFTDDFARIRDAAQPIDGPFVSALADASESMTTVFGIHERVGNGLPFNTLVAVRDGSVVGTYRKLHLYDAFASRESDNVTPADGVPALLDVAGWSVGLMTCYDLRFPELARLLAIEGADVLALPAAWVRGPLKEHHWTTLLAGRALDNTVYLVASGEAGPRNIGRSAVVDPLGVTVAAAAEGESLVHTVLKRARLDEARSRLPVLANRRFDVDPRPRPIRRAS